MQRWWLGVLFGVLHFLGPTGVVAADGPDLAIVLGHVRFVPDYLVSGQRVRLYARVRNSGDEDATAQVLFYVGSQLIGTSQPVSVLADGGFDDVYVDVTVPDGKFNVAVRVGGSDPAEMNTENNEVLTSQFTPVADSDRDSVPDASDNCSANPNEEQEDVDSDGVGDACDSRDDRPSVVAPAVPAVPLVAPSVPVLPVASEPAAPERSVTPTPPVFAPAPAPVAAAEPMEERSVLANLFAASPQLSPQARFSYVRNDWRTVTFTLVQRPGEPAPAAVAWDFGDGTTSARTEVTHVFTRAGNYRVALAVTDAYGNVSADEEVLTLSAFHLSNPLVLLIILTLTALLAASLLYTLRVRNALRRGV